MKHILVIRFSALGDVAMTLPILRVILDENPTLEITFLTRTPFDALFNNIDRLHVIGVDFTKEYKHPLSLLKLKESLTSKYSFDAIIDLHNVLRTKVLRFLFKLSGIKTYVLDKDRKQKKEMIRSKKLSPLPHTTWRYLRVFHEAGIHGLLQNIKLPAVNHLEKDIEAAQVFIHDKSTEFIAFAPFAKHPTKTFPLDKCEALLKTLSLKYTLLLFGGQQEHTPFNTWENQFNNVYSTLSLSFTQQIALISKAKLMISMDSANMHLAAIQNVPVISIWGATHPYFGFSGIHTTPDSWISTKDNVSCRPCSVFGNKPCTNKSERYACLNRIEIADILKAVDAKYS